LACIREVSVPLNLPESSAAACHAPLTRMVNHVAAAACVTALHVMKQDAWHKLFAEYQWRMRRRLKLGQRVFALKLQIVP
jgi:hypothetical protein